MYPPPWLRIVVRMGRASVGGRWRVRATRDRYHVELYVTDPAGAIHHVEVELARLFHPSARTLAQRDDSWWGAVATTAARQFETDLVAGRERAGRSSVTPRAVTVRGIRSDANGLQLVPGTMASVHEFVA
jgi:hypothetical protein